MALVMAVIAYRSKARSLTVAWGAERPESSCPSPVADMSANLGSVTMTPHERAKAANAALTTEQRSNAGKARAAMLHHPTTLARRIAKAWPELSEEDRRAVRAALREAGIIR